MLQQIAAIDAPATDTSSSARYGRRVPEAALIDGLAVSEQKKDFLRHRWLEQLTWMDSASTRASRWYSVLRLVAIVGGVLVPTLVSLTSADDTGTLLRVAAIVIGLLVAICTAVEEFFHFGQKWRHYRRTAEALKSEGWQYFALAGHYRRFASHDEAYHLFAGRVEERFDSEVDTYINEIAREKERALDQGDGERGPSMPSTRG